MLQTRTADGTLAIRSIAMITARCCFMFNVLTGDFLFRESESATHLISMIFRVGLGGHQPSHCTHQLHVLSF